MRIIFTGCTSIQASPVRRGGISKIDVPESVVDALRAAGHEVDWRRVVPGDDLSGYDAAWVSLAPINSLNGRAGAMGALWTLSSGLPAVGYFDDWQISVVFNGMRAVMRNPRMLTKYMLTGSRGDEAATHYSRESIDAAYARRQLESPGARMGRERYYFNDTDDNVLPHAERLLAMTARFGTDRWAAGMVPVCPMYAWGDRSKVRQRMPEEMGPIEALDPSSTIYSLIAGHTPVLPEEKQRGWVLGALMPHNDWVDRHEFTWPLQYLGCKKTVRERGGERLRTESDVIERYNKYWGILSPPYMHAGSGWWRSRFIYAAAVRSVLACEKGEGDPLGRAYQYTPRQIETFSTGDLAALAEDQAAALRVFAPAPGQFTAHVDAIVHRAVHEDRGLRL